MVYTTMMHLCFNDNAWSSGTVFKMSTYLW